jgi:hypothetical protein
MGKILASVIPPFLPGAPGTVEAEAYWPYPGVGPHRIEATAWDDDRGQGLGSAEFTIRPGIPGTLEVLIVAPDDGAGVKPVFDTASRRLL